jgi:hypothetical protein
VEYAPLKRAHARRHPATNRRDLPGSAGGLGATQARRRPLTMPEASLHCGIEYRMIATRFHCFNNRDGSSADIAAVSMTHRRLPIAGKSMKDHYLSLPCCVAWARLRLPAAAALDVHAPSKHSTLLTLT